MTTSARLLTKAFLAFTLSVCALSAFALSAFGIQHSELTAAQPHVLRLFLLGHDIGSERSTIERSGETSTLATHFEYIDRRLPVAIDASLTYRADFSPVSYEAHGKSYRYFAVNASVTDVPRRGPPTFTLEGMAPLAVQGLLVRYWLAHGRPSSVRVLPSGDAVHVRELAARPDLPAHLRHFAIDGVIWGTEHVFLDARDLQVAAAWTTAGVMPFEAVDDRIWTALDDGGRQKLLLALKASARPDAPGPPPRLAGTFAVTHARLIDGTGSAPIEPATIVVRDGRIAAAGASSTTPVPRGVPTIDVHGKSVLPGLWDMHAHVGQPEWGPVYLASGVTTLRDMGGEFDVVTALRDAWAERRSLGPRLLLAGVVDGPGPASFGSVTAADPTEGREVVARYHAAGFQQMKIYDLLDRPTTQAVIDAAHAAGMLVTGHIPRALTLRDAIEMGFDHVAHLAIRGAPGSDDVRETIAFIKAHGTVMDPTQSWNELLGRSASTPIAQFQPGISHVAPQLRRLLEGANGGDVTPEQAHARVARGLAIVEALHEAGVPVVAGTDKGVPGVSVPREIELYVEAGFSPMDAIRAATAVPARAMRLERESGTIAPGLRADFIVVDGDPLAHISDIRKVDLVCTAGRAFEAAALWRAGGFLP
jgi:imidazolonepropionase-like amidohydrolase